MDKPIPIPLLLVVKKGSKIFMSLSLLIPCPLSITQSSIKSSSNCFVEIIMLDSVCSETAVDKSSGNAVDRESMAFFIRLTSTCSI